MKYILLSLVLISCKQNLITDITDREKTVFVASAEDFEGRYLFNNGGYVELYNDYNNKVTSFSSSLIFPNSNNTLATFTFPALSKYDIIEGKITSVLTNMTSVQASNFVGNITGNALDGTQLPNSGSYRYQVVLSFVGDLLNASLEIQQLNGVLYSTVYKNTLKEVK